MATTTPNFGWAVPTSSDLVKNGATAIETLGDSIDASLVDLKGGTTGQVLSKTSGTDMDFTWIAAGGSGSAQVAGKNGILNGDFLINQRAFTSTTTNAVFTFDRWFTGVVGDGTKTYTPQTFTPGAAPIADYEGRTYLQCVTASGTSASVIALIQQNIEDVTKYAGQTITISFFAKAATGTPKIGVELTQNFGTGGSPSGAVYTTATAPTISTAWARYSVTVAVPSISGKTLGTTANTSYIGLSFWFSAGSTYFSESGLSAIQNNTFSIWGVQVETGSSATYFTTATGTLQGELAACQRYYYLYASGTLKPIGIGALITATEMEVVVKFPVTMRTTPTLSATSGTNYYNFQRNGAADNFNSLTLNIGSPDSADITNITEISGTAGQAGLCHTNNASASVAFSAEL